MDLTLCLLFIIYIVKCSDSQNTKSLEYPGTILRPILSDEEAKTLSVEKYLDPWTPENIIIAQKPDYIVGGNNSMYSSIQVALNAAIEKNKANTDRRFILVTAGVYKETVFIPADSGPITIFGEEGTKIVLNQTADMKVEEWINQVNPNGTRYQESDPGYSMYTSCAKNRETIGTRCTSVVWIKNADTVLVNITIQNSAEQHSQAVALRTDAEKIHLDRVKLLSHQDTFYVASGKVFVNNSYLEGDIDYVFGQGTAIFNNCTFHTIADRTSGIIFAPKTDPNNSFGFLVTHSILTADTNFQNSSKVFLGRPWDSSEYIPNESPNGQILIRESKIDHIINATAPWGQGINSKRNFTGNIDVDRDLNDNRFNRFWEYKNY